ncbi:MAG: hypothetical protein DMF54_13325 [Acidobacteria bacterium]|nr:MAG: hypothetical protein DMF54_13325 [Acidobacteriota bacterium]
MAAFAWRRRMPWTSFPASRWALPSRSSMNRCSSSGTDKGGLSSRSIPTFIAARTATGKLRWRSPRAAASRRLRRPPAGKRSSRTKRGSRSAFPFGPKSGARPPGSPSLRIRARRPVRPISEGGFMTEQEFFFQTWSREMPKFDSVMNALDPARLDYRPHPKSRSAAEMVTLLARFQEMLVGMMETGVIDYKDFQADDYDEMRALWKKSTAELTDRLKKLDDAGWKRPVRFLMDGKQINETTTNEMLWGFLHDMIHHRGQLSTYIRPMGGKVPSIYGPSGDAAPARAN